MRVGTRGATFIEYLILAGIVALAAVLAFRQFSQRVTGKVLEQGQVVATLGDVLGSAARGSVDPKDCPGGVCPRPGQCFAAGTLVATAEGLRPIQDVREGDLIWSRDERTGATELRPVVKRYATPAQPVLDLMVGADDSTEPLRVTAAHRFWVPGHGWTAAANLPIAAPLVSLSGEALHLAGLSSDQGAVTVYNFEVAEYHTYFVGRARVWVHNGCGPGSSNVSPTGPPTPPSPPKGDVVVIGSREDTLVAKDWPGHEVLDNPNWSIAVNDAWVQKAVDRNATVYLASPQNHDTLWDDSAGRERVYQRELNQLKDAGYTQVGDYMVPPGTIISNP